MAGSLLARPGRIFISYRREETAYAAGWLYDRLADHYGRSQVFKDVDSIQLGDDFVEVITAAVGSCDVLLALIGREWLTIIDERGRRRLDNPDDFVRLEIEAALARRVRVIPILVDGARIPRADELPDSLARLVRRQALELSPSRFEFDTSRLLNVLDQTLAEVQTAQHDVVASARQPAEKAPESSIRQIPSASERSGQAEQGPAPSRPLAAPATPPTTQSPADAGKPSGKQRGHLSPRARVLVGAGVGVVLILLTVAMLANSHGPRSCIQGFMRREAVPGDLVCVTPESRAQVQREIKLLTATISQIVTFVFKIWCGARPLQMTMCARHQRGLNKRGKRIKPLPHVLSHRLLPKVEEKTMPSCRCVSRPRAA
jgi:TIR domain